MSGQALTYIEIDVPYCALTYGVAPCTASLVSSPPTGTIKCFNSEFTCQDIANIDLSDVALRFAMPATYLPRDIDIVGAYVVSVDYTPAIVSLGEDLGQRATLKIVFDDHKHSDAGEGLDKYHAERGYNPYERGTFWPRLKARHPHPELRGHEVRWITGFVGETIEEMATRHFFHESVDGPEGNGRFTLTAKDVLKFLDGDRAQAPVLSNGFLNAAIDSDDTSATLSPSGIGNEEYPASGYVNIGGNEVCAFTRSNDVLTLTRGQLGSTPRTHDEEDRVQVCLRYAAVEVPDIIEDLITTYSDLPSGYINLANWQVEADSFLDRSYTATITEPTPVRQLVSELVKQAALAIWDDNVNQQLRLQVLRGIPTDAALFDESNIIQGSFKPQDQPDKRVSQVWVYYGQIDPTRRVDEPDNYRSISKTEGEETVGGTPAIYKIFARWIPQFGNTIADRLGQIVLGRFLVAPRKFTFDVFSGNGTEPQLGGGYRVAFWMLQDATGEREEVPIQITRLLALPDRYRVDAEEMLFVAPDDDLTVRRIRIDANTFNFNLKTVHDSLFPELDPGQSIEVTIAEGVIVGSQFQSVPAFDVGTWTGAPSITIFLNGRIQGYAGAGGQGRAGDGLFGVPGGTALFTREMIDLECTSGEIYGGGGGGGAGGAPGAIVDGNVTATGAGGGGGGGAGQTPGTGGAGILGAQSGQPGTTDFGGVGGNASSPSGGQGGQGGSPGNVGDPGQSTGFFNGGAGGAPGNAIDGFSFITLLGGAGDRRGPEIN